MKVICASKRSPFKQQIRIRFLRRGLTSQITNTVGESSVNCGFIVDTNAKTGLWNKHVMKLINIESFHACSTQCLPRSCQIRFNFYMGQSTRKWAIAYIYIYIYNSLYLNPYNFRTITAINLLFSPLYTTPFLYDIIYFGVMY